MAALREAHFCSFVNDVRLKKAKEFSFLGIGFADGGRAEPDRSQQIRAASSSCRFWIGVFHPSTDMGMRFDRRKYRFI